MRHTRKIYVASSWRCVEQPRIVALLRGAGHEVYDFRNPAPGNAGFAWSDIDKEWLGWEPEKFIELLAHPIAAAGFALDKAALDWCDTCVLVLPCGRSAHLEAGYTAGQGKPTIFYLSSERFEPELMYLLGSKCVTTDTALLDAVAEPRTFLEFRRWFNSLPTKQQKGGEAHSQLSRPGHDKSTPAVEAPAAGDCPYCNGSGLFLGGRLSVPPPKCPRCYGSGKAEDVGPMNAAEAGEDDDAFYARILKQNHSGLSRAPAVEMAALARRLAEALDDLVEEMDIRLNRLPTLDSILFSRDVLTEARKAGLIE